ncbi:DUF7146 domain-containing protein [Ferruginivarius sediminum]|uniref:Virulence-associated protein E n=1 Tax=Ferruginivarius sediminum TaxID=2661937 RepID=A0A369TBH5_9PROT|nr:toprim domain-containing protein [Ferruginivarius sediminum]RDD62630.1 virulence-associated protein E [Ferruginivarius sediminum]
MNARALTLALGGRWHGGYGSACCPAHDDGNPSLSIRDGDDGALLTCHAGCERADIIAELRRRGLWEASGKRPEGAELSTRVDNPSRRKLSLRNDNSEAARRIWREAEPAPDTLVQSYLEARGIRLNPPPSLRFAPALRYPFSGIELPAMVAAIQGPDRKLTGVHRTFLRVDGTGKANVQQPKLSLGPQGKGAIRLARAGEVLGLAEGIEDALSAMQMFGIPCWCAISAGRLAKVALPDEVRHVHIFADHGEPGIKAAHEAVEAYTRQRRKVTLRLPPDGFADWNEVLKAEAAGRAA